MKKVKVALIGLGRMGRIHLGHLLHHIPDASVVVVADAFYGAEKFRQEHPGIFFTASPEEATAMADAVVITTPTSTHAVLIEQAVRAGKNVFCEKPLDLSLDVTLEVLKIKNEAGVKLMLGFNRRFDPDFLQARRAVSDGKIGEVQIVKITNRDPAVPPVEFLKTSGGLFMDFSIHDFDMARYVTGKEVVDVFAKGLVFIDEAVKEAADIDTALITLTFDDGTYAVIDNSRKAVYGYDQRLEIFGSGGMVQVENNLYHRNVVYDAAGIHHALPLNSFPERYAASYKKEMELFIAAIVTGGDLPVSDNDVVAATAIAYAAKRSMDEGVPVKVTDVQRRKADQQNS